MNMERLQIYIDPELNRKLTDLSHRLGLSKASLIRDGVRLLLRDKGSLSDDPLMGMKKASARSGRRDLSQRHDAFLAGVNRISASWTPPASSG